MDKELKKEGFIKKMSYIDQTRYDTILMFIKKLDEEYGPKVLFMIRDIINERLTKGSWK